jgi:TRAP-type mannitol/chloroaromatic compound transport system permease small subunit
MAFFLSNTVSGWAVFWLNPLLATALLLLVSHRAGLQTNGLQNVSRRMIAWIDWLNTLVINIAKWLAPGMALLVAALVISRYVFGISAIKPQEAVVYMHALLFLFAAPATLLTNGHVRVDIIYEGLTERGRAIVDLLGTFLLLMPVCILIFKYGGSYAARAWVFREASVEANGLQAVYLLKTAIPVFALLFMAQGSVMALRAALLLIGAPIAPPEIVEERV